MARLPLIQPDDLPAGERALLSSGINLHKVLAHSPRAVERFRALTTFVRDESSIDPRLRELALIQIGYTAKCAYEYTHHIKVGFANGVTPDDVKAVAADSAGRPTNLDPLTRAVLQAAREMTGGHAVSSDAFALLQRSLGNEALVDLCVAIVAYIATVRLLETFEVDLEEPYRTYIAQFPLPA